MTGPEDPTATGDLPLEASEADVVETVPGVADLPSEASAADALEQAQAVPFDEDDHRA